MRLKLICAVLVGTLLVVAPGCGSKKKSESTTTKAATTTQEATTSTTATTSAGGSKLTGDDCQKLAAASETFNSAVGGKVANDMNDQIARLQALAKVAPDEIKGDFQVLADAGAKFAQLNLKAGETPTPAQLSQLLAELDVQKLTTASMNISAWAEKNCSAP